MKFFKLYDVEASIDLYINPSTIKYYLYDSDNVEIILDNNEIIRVDKQDFEEMKGLGIFEYDTHNTL